MKSSRKVLQTIKNSYCIIQESLFQVSTPQNLKTFICKDTHTYIYIHTHTYIYLIIYVILQRTYILSYRYISYLCVYVYSVYISITHYMVYYTLHKLYTCTHIGICVHHTCMNVHVHMHMCVFTFMWVVCICMCIIYVYAIDLYISYITHSNHDIITTKVSFDR